jgi:hypothetical protein
MKKYLIIFGILNFFTLSPGANAQQDEAVALTQQALSDVFQKTEILKVFNLSDINELGDHTEAVFVNGWSLNVPGVTVAIKSGPVTFRHLEPADASLPMSRLNANLRFSVDVPFTLNGREYTGIMSLWNWADQGASQQYWVDRDENQQYIVLRITGGLYIRDFETLLADMGVGDVPMMNKIENTGIQNPEVIIPVGIEPMPMVFAMIHATLADEHKDVDAYFFKMDDIDSFSLLFDFHSIPIRLQELAKMVEAQAQAAGLSQPFAIFDPGTGQVRDAAVVVASKAQELSVDDLDPVMQVPFYRIYGENKSLPLHFLRGINMVAKFVPQDFSAFYSHFEKLNVPVDVEMTVQGSLGWESAQENEDEKAPEPKAEGEPEKESAPQPVGQYLKAGLYVGLNAWNIPQYLQEKGYEIVQGAGCDFFVELTPAALQLGVASQFLMNVGSPNPVQMVGALESVFTTSDIALALAGKMDGVWRMPANIPFALKDAAVKVKITTDDTYFFGAKGTSYLGHEGDEMKILLGGNLGIQYTGE